MPKFQPSMTKIVGGVCVQRNKMATILYMYRFSISGQSDLFEWVADGTEPLGVQDWIESAAEGTNLKFF